MTYIVVELDLRPGGGHKYMISHKGRKEWATLEEAREVRDSRPRVRSDKSPREWPPWVRAVEVVP